MARSRRSKLAARDAALSPLLAAHMARLDLATVAEYQQWCKQHGLSSKVDKSAAALARELEEVQLQKVREVAQARRRIRDPLAAMKSALAGGVDLDLIHQHELRRACEALSGLSQKRMHREQLLGLLTTVADRADFLLDSDEVSGQSLPYLRGVIALNDFRGQWLRDCESWRPRSHNRRKQFASLARHLIADYHVPGFLDAAWLRDDAASYSYRDLFVHVGRGGNPRTAKMPITVTKKVAHWFMQAPESYSIEAAVRWGQVHALGGGPRLSEVLATTPLARSFEHEEFWQSVIAFFVANPMLDVAQVGPLIDYIDHMKFRPLEIVQPDGGLATQPPPQPGFSMARRTPESLLRQMERWHATLGRASQGGVRSWPAFGMGELHWETGLKTKRCWRVRELRSFTALQIEGRAMGHCVASYVGSCVAGRCSIWALELETKDGLERRLTVEVSRQKVIVQVRGKHNRGPEVQELAVLRRWAEQEELGLATYL